MSRALPALSEVLAGPRQRLDACADRLPRALIANARLHHNQLARVATRLSPRLLQARLTRGRELIASFGERARRARRIYLDRRLQRLESAWQLLNAYSYRKVLERGFALVRDGDGRPLHAAAAVAPGMRLDIEFADGRVAAVADGEARAPARAKPRRGGEGGSGQGSLFGS